jgi:glycogen debranching enzyme-like protein
MEGSSLCISQANGDINPEAPPGVFHEDTRILSHWYLVNGRPLEPLATELKEPFRALFIGRVPLATALLEAAEYSDGRLPELFFGFSRGRDRCPPSYPTARAPQAWAPTADPADEFDAL